MKYFLSLFFLFAGIVAKSQQVYDADLGSYIDITDRIDPYLYIKDTQFDTLNQTTINAGATVTLTNNAGVTVSRGKMLDRWVNNKIMPARTGKTYNVRVDFRAIPTVSVGSYGRLLIDIGGT